MKRKQITAILMSAIMTVSACMPMNGISAMAAETAGASGTEVSAEVEADAVADADAQAEAVEEPTQEPTAEPAVTVEEPTQEPASEPGAEPEQPAVSEDVDPEEPATTGEDGGEAEVSTEAGTEADAVDEAATDGYTADHETATEEEPGEEEESQPDQAGEGQTAPEEEISEDGEEVSTKKDAKMAGDPTADDFANARSIAVGDSISVSLDENNTFEMFRFTPDVSAKYIFYADASGYCDTFAELFDESGTQLLCDDDGNDDSEGCFKLGYDLEAGCTYYYRALMLNEEDTGSFVVYLSKKVLTVADIPSPVFCSPGDSVTLSTSAQSSEPITYVWAVEGETVDCSEADYTFAPGSSCNVTCTVSSGGESAEVHFHIIIENNLQVFPKGEEEQEVYLLLTEGEPATLEVEATADDMEGLTYQWTVPEDEFDEEHPEKYTSSSYLIESVGTDDDYECRVTDKYGNYSSARFYVNSSSYNNGLRAYIYLDYEDSEIDETYISINPEENLELSYIATSDKSTTLTYQWYFKGANDEDYELLAQTEGPEYTVSPDDSEHFRAGSYKGVVSDQFGASAEVTFDVTINNNLMIYCQGCVDPWEAQFYTIPAGGSKELVAYPYGENLSGATYRWTKGTDEDETILEEGTLEGDSITYVITDVNEDMVIHCYITDRYGNKESCRFNIEIPWGWNAYPDGGVEDDISVDISILPDESTTLKVITVVDDGYDLSQLQLNYVWKSVNEDYERTVLESDEGHPDQLTVNSDNVENYFECVISDAHNHETSLVFDVSVNSGLTAAPSSVPEGELKQSDYDGLQYTVYVLPGESLTLKANASVQNGDGVINYVWSQRGLDDDFEEIENATGSELTIDSISRVTIYQCAVSDSYGNKKYLEYVVCVNNNLRVYPQSVENGDTAYIWAEPGSNVELNVIVQATDTEDMTYRWNEDGYSFEQYSGTLTVQAGKNSYSCKVTDKYGNSEVVYFRIRVDNGLEAYPEGEEPDEFGIYKDYREINAQAGDELDLRVVASTKTGEPTYTWSRTYRYESTYGYDYENVDLGEENSDSIHITVEETTEYYCRVEDGYGNEKEIVFEIHVGYLRAHPEGTEEDEIIISAEQGESRTLRVVTEAYEGAELTYKWFSGSVKNYYTDWDEVETSGNSNPNELAIVQDGSKGYMCLITDQYHNEAKVCFYTIIETLEVSTNQGALELLDNGCYSIYVTVKNGQSIDLKSIIETDHPDSIRYVWYRWNYSYYLDTDDTDDTYTVVGDSSLRDMMCEVIDISTDDTDRATIFYHLSVDNELTVTPVGAADGEHSVDIYADEGEQVTLNLNVSALDETDLRYTWYDAGKRIVGSGANYALTASGNAFYRCVVKDRFGNEAEALFCIRIGGNALSNAEITLEQDSYVYDGNPKTPAVTVILDGNTLVENTDYTVSYNNNVDAGTAEAVITGKTLNGSATKEFTIEKAAQTPSCEVSDIGFGETKTFTVTDSFGGISASVDNTDVASVTVDGSNISVTGLAAGTATLTITAAGDNNHNEATVTRTITVIKAGQAPSCEVSDITFGETKTFEVADSFGELSASVDNVSVAAVAVDGSNISVTGLAAGTATLTITAAGDSNHNAAVITCSITVLLAEQAPECEVSDISFGETKTFAVTDAYGELSASIDNTSVASVAVNGTNISVTGLAAGTATLTITAAGDSGHKAATITRPINIQKIGQTPSCEVSDISFGETKTFAVTDSYGEISASIDNTDVASVTVDGTNISVTGLAVGTATLTITAAGDDNHNAESVIRPITVTKATQTPECAVSDLSIGETKTFAVTNAYGELSASVDNTDVASVTVDGANISVTGLTTGTATLTITAAGDDNHNAATVTRTITVKKLAQSPVADVDTITVAAGKTKKITVSDSHTAISASGVNEAIATATVSEQTVSVKGIKVGTYELTLTAASDDTYESATVASASGNATIKIKVVPAATTSLTAANANKGIKVTWKKVTGATNYVIKRQAGSGSWKTVKTVGNVATYTDTYANTNGTKYTYRVYAKAATGTSNLYKSVVVYKVLRPTISSVTNSASKKMTVKWAKNAKATGYQIQYGLKSSFSGAKPVKITKNTIVSKVIGSLTKGKKYYVRMRSYKSVSGKIYYSTWSATKTVTIKK